MKKIYNIKIYLLLVVLFATSCSDFLDETPDNRLRLDSYDKIAELVTNAYPASSSWFLEVMSDNVGPEHRANQMHVSASTYPYKWEDTPDIMQDTPSYFWNANYSAIAHANQALLALDDLPLTDIDRYNAIKGEALACRAYAHFMLVNVFAKHYNEATASSDLGVVFMTDPETTLLATYERISVAEMYRLIELDLQEALKLVTNTYYKNSGKYHFTTEAVCALASRFYLFKGDWAKCIEYSDALLGKGNNSSFVRDNYSIFRGADSEICSRQFTNPKEKSNLLLVKYPFYYGYLGVVGYRFPLSQLDEFREFNDTRFDIVYVYSGAETAFLSKFERELEEADGYSYTVAVALRSEETILNRAEAYLMLDDIANAETYLGYYTASIYTGNGGTEATIRSYEQLKSEYKKLNPTLVNDKDLILKIILEERRKEFIEECLRWYDIKRYNMTVTHTDIYGETDTLTADDPRKVIPIPFTAVEVGGLQQNPSGHEGNIEAI